MKYRVRQRIVSEPLYEIEADSLAEAVQKFEDGDKETLDEDVSDVQLLGVWDEAGTELSMEWVEADDRLYAEECGEADCH